MNGAICSPFDLATRKQFSAGKFVLAGSQVGLAGVAYCLVGVEKPTPIGSKTRGPAGKCGVIWQGSLEEAGFRLEMSDD